MTAPATLLAALARRPASARSDVDLLARFVSDGDPTAFEDLVRRHGRLVWRVARTRCRTDATAEDVFQATFAVLNRKAKSVRNPGALAGWLHRTAHRLAVRATRRERPAVPLPRDLPRNSDPLDALTARELLAAVDDELAKLTDTERAVLLLCGIDGVSNSEAAAGLGWSAGSVKGRLERARVKLRDRLAARGLTLPAVLVGLIGFAPPASAVEAAVSLPLGGAVSPAVAELITGTFTMKAKTALVAAFAGVLLLTGGFMTDNAMTPTADAKPFRPASRRNAPVPKDTPKAVLWSEQVRMDWKGSGAESINGVWAPDGASVLVPTPTVDDTGKPVPGGGVDFRDAKTGKVWKTLTPRAGDGKTVFQTTGIAIDAKGKCVFAVGSKYDAGLWDKLPGATLCVWRNLTTESKPDVADLDRARATAVVSAPNGEMMLTLDGTSTVQAHGRRTWTATIRPAPAGRLAAAAFAPTGDWWVAAHDSGKLFTGTPDHAQSNGQELNGFDAKFRAVAISPDGETVAAGGEAGRDGYALVTIAGSPKFEKLVEPKIIADAVPAKERINGLAFSPDGKRLAAACSDGVLRVFDVKTGKLAASAKEHKAEIFSVAYSPDGKKLLTVGRDAMKVWDVSRLMAK